MSVLTFLCFTSLLYFTLADPIGLATSGSIPSEVPSPDPSNIQSQIVEAIMEDVQKTIDLHLIMPNKNKMNQADLVYIKDTATQAIYGSLNYLLFLIYDNADPKSGNSDAENNYLIFEYIPQNGPFMPGNSYQSEGAGNK